MKTPQVKALPGMTPLGLTPPPSKAQRAATLRVRERIAALYRETDNPDADRLERENRRARKALA